MTAMATQYAPAERAAPEDLDTQRRYFSDAWFFGELLHYVPDMVMIVNGQRQVVYANRSVLEITGAKDLAAVVGKRPGEVLRCKHSDESEGGCGTTAYCRYCGAVNSILASQKGRFAVEEWRLTVEREGGEAALDLKVWASPMQFGGQRFTFLAIGDIGEEKKRLFLERIFLHDVMNTASALRGFSKLLGTESLDQYTRKEFSRRIASLSNRIIDEIEAHRELLAAEHDELTPEVARLNSVQLLTEVFDAYNRPDILDDRGLGIAAGSDAVEFESDRTLLQRVLGNMVKNGIEASIPGERVTMGCRADGTQVAFWVQNPTYMPEKVRLQIFNRSFSTKGSDRGLGTYSMKFLTERYLGGEIGFTSSEDEGTTFTARYPLVFPSALLTRSSP
jgi:signal transduction histidine kinase